MASQSPPARPPGFKDARPDSIRHRELAPRETRRARCGGPLVLGSGDPSCVGCLWLEQAAVVVRAPAREPMPPHPVHASDCLAHDGSSFLFAYTAEGLQVWTFPSDSLPTSSDGSGHAGLREATGAGAKRPLLSLSPCPRPCLLHVQKLEVSAVGAYGVQRRRMTRDWFYCVWADDARLRLAERAPITGSTTRGSDWSVGAVTCSERSGSGRAGCVKRHEVADRRIAAPPLRSLLACSDIGIRGKALMGGPIACCGRSRQDRTR